MYIASYSACMLLHCNCQHYTFVTGQYNYLIPYLFHCPYTLKVSIVAVKFIPYFTDSSEKVVIAISLARIYVNNVAPISVDACLVHSDKLRT